MAADPTHFVKGVLGFPTDIEVTFTTKPDENLICCSCESVTLNGHADPKGHLYCGECSAVFTDQAGNFTCLSCAWKGKPKKMTLNSLLREKVDGLYAYCPRGDNTCQFKGKLLDTIKHYQQCSDPAKVDCPFCKNRFEKKYLLGHIQRECPCRLAQCRHCRVDMEAHLLQKHEHTCDMRSAECEYCNLGFKTFAELRDRHLDCCTQRPRKCTFAGFGCQFQGNKMQVDQHMQATSHTDVLVQRVCELTSQMQELRQKSEAQSLAITAMDEKHSRTLNAIEEKLEHLANMSAVQSADLQAQKDVQTTQKEVWERLFKETESNTKILQEDLFQKLNEVPMEFTHVWKIQPYTYLRDATVRSSVKRLSSGKLYTNTPGYCIEFLVDLNVTSGEATCSHVGAQFKIHSGEYDELMPWPFSSRIVLTLKNHFDPSNSVQLEIVPKDSRPALQECFEKPQAGMANKIFGFSRVIATPLLENESKGFLLANCVVLTFDIYPHAKR